MLWRVPDICLDAGKMRKNMLYNIKRKKHFNV